MRPGGSNCGRSGDEPPKWRYVTGFVAPAKAADDGRGNCCHRQTATRYTSRVYHEPANTTPGRTVPVNRVESPESRGVDTGEPVYDPAQFGGDDESNPLRDFFPIDIPSDCPCDLGVRLGPGTDVWICGDDPDTGARCSVAVHGVVQRYCRWSSVCDGGVGRYAVVVPAGKKKATPLIIPSLGRAWFPGAKKYAKVKGDSTPATTPFAALLGAESDEESPAEPTCATRASLGHFLVTMTKRNDDADNDDRGTAEPTAAAAVLARGEAGAAGSSGADEEEEEKEAASSVARTVYYNSDYELWAMGRWAEAMEEEDEDCDDAVEPRARYSACDTVRYVHPSNLSVYPPSCTEDLDRRVRGKATEPAYEDYDHLLDPSVRPVVRGVHYSQTPDPLDRLTQVERGWYDAYTTHGKFPAAFRDDPDQLRRPRSAVSRVGGAFLFPRGVARALAPWCALV